jgi:hypothetical protein
MAPLTADACAPVVRASDGGVEPRGVRLHAAPRPPQAPRPGDQQRRQPRAPDVTAFKQRGRPAVAGATAAAPALATWAPGWQATVVAPRPVRPPPRADQRGCPGQGTPPDQGVSRLAGALARRIAARQARIDPQRWVIGATHALDDPLCPPQER